MAPYPAGTEIVLADGRQAIVASVRAECVELPLVRVHADAYGQPITPEEIDLGQHRELAPRDGLAPAA